MTVPMDQPALEARAVSVAFGAVKALTEVTFSVRRGEVVALVGDNGAGKSTLVKALSGIRPPDQGQILVAGEARTLDTPRRAHELGIATVHQDLALCNEIDVVGNLFLGDERVGRGRFLDEVTMEIEARDLLMSLNARTIVSLRQKVAQMSGGQRQSIAIARSIRGNPDVILLDEPTAALGVSQTHEVLALIDRLREQNRAVVLISHNMSDVFQVADRIHVLRLGRTNGLFRTQDVTTTDVVAAITGAADHTTEGSAA